MSLLSIALYICHVSKLCKELQRMLRNLHAGSAASAPHCKRVLRGSTQHHRPACGGLAMLLRWHSDESIVAKGWCMKSMNLVSFFPALVFPSAQQGSGLALEPASSGVARLHILDSPCRLHPHSQIFEVTSGLSRLHHYRHYLPALKTLLRRFKSCRRSL